MALCEAVHTVDFFRLVAAQRSARALRAIQAEMRIACVSQFMPGNQKTVHFYDLSAGLISGRAATQENRYETFGQNASCHGRHGNQTANPDFQLGYSR